MSAPGGASPAALPPNAPPSGVDARRERAPLTLRRRLVLGLVATLVIVTAVIGAVSVTLLHNVLVDRLDQQLSSASDRGREGASGPGDTGGPLSITPNATFVLKLPGQAEGTVGAVIDEGMGDEIRVTLIATGFDKRAEPYSGFQRTERGRGPVDRGPRIDDRQRSSLEIRDDEIDIPPFLR